MLVSLLIMMILLIILVWGDAQGKNKTNGTGMSANGGELSALDAAAWRASIAH